MGLLSRLLRQYLLPYWPQTILTYLCMILTTVAGLAVPQIIKQVIDVGLARRQPTLVTQSALAIIGLNFASGLLSFGHRYLHGWLSQHLAYDIRNDLYDHVQRLSFSFHDKTETGQLISRSTSDVRSVLRFSSSTIMQAMNSLLLSVIAIAILVSTDWRLTCVSLLPMPFVAYLAIQFRRRIRPVFRAIQQQFGLMTTVIQENILAAQVVRAFAREDYEINKFKAEVNRLRANRLQAIRYWVSNNQLNVFLFSLCTTLLLVYGGPKALAGQLTVGTLVAFSGYLALLSGPVQQIGEIVNTTTEATAAAERIFEILDTKPLIREKPDAKEIVPIQGKVTFQNVYFRYSGDDMEADRPYAIENVSFTALPNQVIGIVGSTGCGKSTLISLIPRFYDVTSGAVLVDDIDVRDIALRSLRSQIGIVMQEPLLFTGTIRENIAYGRPDASLEEIIECAKIAQAHDFIMSFPDGYDTFVGERGYTLSGGQRQRVSLARALLLNPRILILDDATSSVDTETEHLIQLGLAKAMKGRTTFVVAQRLTTVKDANMILVMDAGKIVEQGTHEELLANDGLYKKMYDLQLRDQEEQLVRDKLAGFTPRMSRD